jgi:hypothetical protein
MTVRRLDLGAALDHLVDVLETLVREGETPSAYDYPEVSADQALKMARRIRDDHRSASETVLLRPESGAGQREER